MSGLPMMACNDRRPMSPVVHWITRNGRSALIGRLLCRSDWTLQSEIRTRRKSAALGVQPGELVLAVLLDTRGAADLAARRRGNGPGFYQYEVPDIQAVRIRNRG